MKVNKKYIIYIISIIIIIISFVLPITMLKREETGFGLILYEEIPKRSIRTDIKNIYLVKAIHEIETATEKVVIDPKTKIVMEYSAQNFRNNIEKEIQNLASFGIISNILEDENYNIEINPKRLVNNSVEYTINDIFIIKDKVEYSFEIEEKSGKVIFMYVDKELINFNLPKEEILMSYIKYLGLEIIDDWKYEDGLLSSEKADVAVALIKNEKENKYVLSFYIKK